PGPIAVVATANTSGSDPVRYELSPSGDLPSLGAAGLMIDDQGVIHGEMLDSFDGTISLRVTASASNSTTFDVRLASPSLGILAAGLALADGSIDLAVP